MALGDLKASPFSQASIGDSNQLSHGKGYVVGQSNDVTDSATDTTSSSHGNATTTTFATSTSMAYLPQTVFLCELRHEGFEAYVPSAPSDTGLVHKWRNEDPTKTVCGALVLCLDSEGGPPDVIKISPCATTESWIDPASMASGGVLEAIGAALGDQYEKWQPKAHYEVLLNPTMDKVKQLCTTCRKYAKSERVLFHYNGHGVPKPTANGEIWLFDKIYEYVPLPVSKLDFWLKTPSVYVFDCSAAGAIVNAFTELQDQSASSSSGPSLRDCILLAACGSHETLPQSADFPADVFTSCLMTPIKMALRWLCSHSLLSGSFDYSLIDNIPGCPNDRKTPLGELNWIFAAVTNTIAWNILPRDVFQRLFRQDVLVASLFRNFLLADRIMRSANCSPISYPLLQPAHHHHMWDAWDMAAEICLSQIPILVEDPKAFQPSSFFTDQLTAFELWLDHGSQHKKPPEQLPIVLQVLLSPRSRFRALMLLGRFLDMGPWAVDLSLSVGLFPYALKLLRTTNRELQNILVFIWSKILAFDKSCRADLINDGGHTYFIRFLDSWDAYPEQRAMAAFVLAMIVDGNRRGQEACIKDGLIHVCLKHLQGSAPNNIQTEPLLLQWLCLCIGKLWEDSTVGKEVCLQAAAPSIYDACLYEPYPEVRASAVFALGTLLDVGSDSSINGIGEDEDGDNNAKVNAEISIIKSLLDVVWDGSPLVRAEVAVALARFAHGHNKHLKSIAAAYVVKPQYNSVHSSFSLFAFKGISNDYSTNEYIPNEIIVPSQITSLLKVDGNNDPFVVRDGSSLSRNLHRASGVINGSPLSDDSFQHSDSVILNDCNGVVNPTKLRSPDNSLYPEVVVAMRTLAKDPSPRIANLGRQVLSIIGIEQMVTKSVNSTGCSVRSAESTGTPTSSLAGLTKSFSWFDLKAGHFPLTLKTPPVSPRPSYLTGMRRVYSLECMPHLYNSPDSRLDVPRVGSGGSAAVSEGSFLPQSTIYNWSCGHFSKPLLTAADGSEEIIAKREERENFALDHIAKCHHSSVQKLHKQIARWDTKFETGAKSVLLQPISSVVVAADENEWIRIWNYKEATLLNSFDNHDKPNKGLSKLCLVNDLDDSLLLVASSDGNIRIWKDYSLKDEQQLVTAFSSIQGYRPGDGSANVVVDWQQQSGYLYASSEISSIMAWDLNKEQLVNSIPSSSNCFISALSASQVHGGQFTAGFLDGSIRLFDVRTPQMLVCATWPGTPRVERIVGIGFQPGFDTVKIVSASEPGVIQFFDIRHQTGAYLTINAHRGSLTAFAVHRHAPIIASRSAEQLIKVHNLEGKLLDTIGYYHTFRAQKIGSVSSLSFHPYQVLLAAGAADACISIYGD